MFNFDALFENDLVDVRELAAHPLLTLDGEAGYISHLLVGPTSNAAEWAVVIDEDDEHHVVPVSLLTWDGDSLHLELRGDTVESRLAIEDPDQVSAHRLTKTVIDALDALGHEPGGAAIGLPSVVDQLWDTIDRSLVAGAGKYEVHSIDDLSTYVQNVVAPTSTPDAPTIGEPDYWEAVLPPDQQEPDLGERPTPPVGGHPSPPIGGSWTVGGDEVRSEPAEATGRTLVADLPKKVHVERRFSVQVQVSQGNALSGASGFLPGAAGRRVTINATVPESFEVHSELTFEIDVPESGDSNPSLLSFTPRAIGTFPIKLTAFAGGTYLGELHTEVSVAYESSGTSREASSNLSQSAGKPGEVSLQITFDDDSQTFRYSFLAGGDWRNIHSPVIKGNLQARIESVIQELDTYARNKSGLSEADAQQRIRTRGFELWRDLVPDDLKTAIFDHLDNISQLTIICDREIVPWELLYPQSAGGDEPGFLVSLFPVNRWVLATPWRDRLTLTRPAFVLPDNSPSLAGVEIEAVKTLLDSPTASPVKTRQQLLARLDEPDFDLLHFACHNTFVQGSGNHINFPDMPFTPGDLALKAATKPLGRNGCLVFVNACRTQGTTPVYTTFENWAKSFLDLGATAVIGTSWAVRDRAARPFAEAVYERLSAGDSLGHAVATARAIVSTTIGDPTWLAYTVYGDPDAKVVPA